MLEPLIHDLASQFLYDVARTTVVTFDDADSIGDKATYAHGAGLAGAFAWSLNQVRRTTACAHVLNLTAAGLQLHAAECSPFWPRFVVNTRSIMALRGL